MLYLPQLATLLILITLPHSAYSQSCQNSYAFDDSDLFCYFFYDYTDSNCTQYNFLSCTWAECQDYLSSSSDTCLSYQTLTSADWNTCTNICCDSSVQYPETYDSISQCQDYLISYSNLMTIVGWSVFGGGLFIVGTITLICLLCKYGWPRCRCRCKCECERLEECCESSKEMFNKICCECVLLKKKQQPEHAKQEDASKDLEMTINPDMKDADATINPDMNTPAGNDRVYI